MTVSPLLPTHLIHQDSVPAALTKDKKRIDGSEVNVHLAWRSTLYVTNFPEKWDDTSVRDLFGQVGGRFRPSNRVH